MRFIDGDEVRRRLTYAACIPIVRAAMISLSRGETLQLLRSILPLSEGRLFGVMPGALGAQAPFGAKIVSAFADNHDFGKPSHQGLVLLFDPRSGAPVCAVDATAVTAIRTAAASAVATDVLARRDARRLAILGTGEQALTHARALMHVRAFEEISVWGRTTDRARGFAARMATELAIPVVAAPSVEAAGARADVICTVTGASEPILLGRQVQPGTHVNVVGSSFAGPSEIDSELVVRARFIADFREGILRQGAEFLHAKAAGLVTDAHVVGEIGQVLDGQLAGRTSDDEITIYKSIGHVVQDLASAWALYASVLP